MLGRRELVAGACAAVATGILFPTRSSSQVPVGGRARERCDYIGNGLNECSAELNFEIEEEPAFRDPQYGQNWCWAACISACFRWHGYRVPQATIVSALFGAQIDQGATIREMRDVIYADWVDAGGRPFFGIPIMAIGAEGARRLLARNISIHHPAIVCSLSHAMLAVGAAYVRNGDNGVSQVSWIDVYDPWPGSDRIRRLSDYELSRVVEVMAVGVKAGTWADAR